MAHHIEITQMDHQIPLLDQTSVNESQESYLKLGMANNTEIVPLDHRIALSDQNPLREAKKDEIEEVRKVAHLIEKKETSGQDQLALQTKKAANQIFEEKVKDMDNSSIKSTTIFKVNVCLRESNSKAYTPKTISIGPYHNKRPQLGSMEKYKWLYLQRFLKRKTEIDVKSYINEMEKLKDEALKCYDDNLDSDIVVKFSQMLLLDGCFVVEFIRERCEVEPEESNQIINLEWMINQVCLDMVLLEYQLPFFVLTMLHDMTKNPTERSFLNMVRTTLLNIFPKVTFMPPSEIDDLNAENIDHLLDAVHMFCRPSHDQKTRETKNASSRGKECCKISFCGNILQLTRSKEIPDVLDLWDCYHIPSATELYNAGVSFSKIGSVAEDVNDKTTLFDINFEKGLMKIPCFTIEDTMETFMRNLIAYEQHSSGAYPYFSNYAHIMTQLIGSHRDVNLLRQNKIILKDLGDDKEVASIFKKLSSGVIVTDFYYREECSKLIQHCEKPWSQMMASLRHNYFQSPWAGASTVAAITLLILTVIQTILAFKENQKKRKQDF
ncbi:UPF0481 protein At3g47200-like [Nicotiana tomentosiformis]|uniref:UPF0481 protein At3g47200-like n=1 Tax=Nicotiana tomentosiformis TaxID=4098 RepID=UPI00051B713E|nr:UPF0481 protein At3g47200-like isoform X2 [Nicotiana tomentosiformis]